MRAFSAGRSPNKDALAAEIGLEPRQIATLLRSLDENDVLKLRDGEIASAYPFSAEPTRHQVLLPGRKPVFALCAIDALGIPFMLGEEATVNSTCPACGRPIAIEVTEGRANTDNRDVVVWVPTRKVDGKIADCLCPDIDFICSSDETAAWQKKIGFAGVMLELAETMELGDFIFSDFLTEN